MLILSVRMLRLLLLALALGVCAGCGPGSGPAAGLEMEAERGSPRAATGELGEEGSRRGADLRSPAGDGALDGGARAQRVAVLLRMDSHSAQQGKSQAFGLGYRFAAGDGFLDSEPVARGVLEPEGRQWIVLQVPAGARALWVRAEGPGCAQIKALRDWGGEASVRLTLRARSGATSRGKAVCADGTPVTHGRVVLDPYHGGSLGGLIQADGSFEAHSTGSGGAQLRLDGFEQGSALLDLEGYREARPPQDLAVALEPGMALRGQLVNASGHALPGVRLVIVNGAGLAKHAGSGRICSRWSLGLEDHGRSGDVCTTDGEGRFRAEGLAPGTYSVLARRDGGGPLQDLTPAPLWAGPGQHQVLLPARRLRVRVARADGSYAAYNPLAECVPTETDGTWSPLGDELRVTLGSPESPESSAGDADFFFDDFGDARPTTRWFRTEDPTVWEVSVPPDLDLILSIQGRDVSAVHVPVHMPETVDFQEQIVRLGQPLESGVLKLEVPWPAGSLPLEAFWVRLTSEQGPELAVPDLLPAGKGEGELVLEARFSLPPGSYQATLQPTVRKGIQSWGYALPRPVTRSVVIAPGGLARASFEFEERCCVRFGLRARPNDEPLHVIEAESGRRVATYAWEGRPEALWASSGEVDLPPGRYKVVGRFAAGLRTFPLDLGPRGVVGVAWTELTGGGWVLGEYSVRISGF